MNMPATEIASAELGCNNSPYRSKTRTCRKDIKMSTEQKKTLIWAIISHLKFIAQEQKKAFDVGDTFFSLAFRSDDELKHIAKQAGL